VNPIDKLTILVSKTADGRNDYVQVLSGDQFSLNVVLIARKITIRDVRPTDGTMPEVTP